MCLRNWTAEKPAWPSNTAAKEKPSRREPVRSTTSSSISSRAPCSLALPHRMTSTSDDGGPAAATPPAAVAWHRTPRPQHRIPTAAAAVPAEAKVEGGSRGTRGLSRAIFDLIVPGAGVRSGIRGERHRTRTSASAAEAAPWVCHVTSFVANHSLSPRPKHS